MNQASVIRDKILEHALKRKVSQEALEKHGEETINRRILTPLCVIDIAYGIWQENFVNLSVKQEMKILKKRVQALFHEGMFSRDGVIYKSLTDEEVCYLSDHADNLNDAIKEDLGRLYYSLQSKSMDMPTQERSIFCNILVMETILLVAQSSMFYDWNCKYPTLDKAVSSLSTMARVYRQQVLGGKNSTLVFDDKDMSFVNGIKIINRKLYEVAV